MEWIDTVNDLLADEDSRRRARFGPAKLPVTFIFALPRGASTPFHQLILSSMQIGYASNIMARFWRAPYLGALLQEDMQTNDYVSNFRSKLGNTFGPLEPHEWGWFWRHWLRLKGDDHYCSKNDPPDFKVLSSLFGAIESVTEAPLIFDSVFAMANIREMRQAIPKTLAAHVIRPPYYVCNSIIKGRLARSGNLSEFYGHRPRNIDDILKINDPVEQIVRQVKSILDEMERDLASFSSDEVFTVHQDELLDDFNAITDRYAHFLTSHDVEVTRKTNALSVRFKSRNTPSLIEPAYRECLNKYFEKIIGPIPPGA